MDLPYAIAFADGGSSWWIDSPVRENSKYQTMLIELLSHLEERYKVGGSRDKRAVTGWSMGGYGAFMLAADYPGKFGAVSSMIGGLDFPFQDLHTAPPTSVFGTRGSAWNRLSPTRRAIDLESTNIGIFGSSKGQDMPHNAAMHSALEEAGISHTYEIVIGYHDIGTTLVMWPKVLAFHAKTWGMQLNPDLRD
jgi:S-formylglutathione hydrolase FrmB